jgi:hypothetical protein
MYSTYSFLLYVKYNCIYLSNVIQILCIKKFYYEVNSTRLPRPAAFFCRKQMMMRCNKFIEVISCPAYVRCLYEYIVFHCEHNADADAVVENTSTVIAWNHLHLIHSQSTQN